jgi:threonine/homoserine/homoserine lactone efflux protein
VQGPPRTAGLGALIGRAQPVFQIIKWAGCFYLAYLGVLAIRSAIRGRYATAPVPASYGWRQGFLSNITNPKVLMFYLAVLPQFLVRAPAPPLC